MKTMYELKSNFAFLLYWWHGEEYLPVLLSVDCIKIAR